MEERSVLHGSFTVERSYPASPARVFRAWADPAAKLRWFSAPDEGTELHELDFRVGGREQARGRAPNGKAYRFDALYYDIIENARIVYTYDMSIEGRRISVSLATAEFQAQGRGTKLVYTEHGAFLDGLDEPRFREQGTRELFDALERELLRTEAGR